MGNIPRPLAAGRLCKTCKGTGADIERTLQMPRGDIGYARCWPCNGNGLDPAEYFNWTEGVNAQG